MFAATALLGSGLGFMGGNNEEFVAPEGCEPILAQVEDGTGYANHDHVGQGLHLQDGSCIEVE